MPHRKKLTELKHHLSEGKAEAIAQAIDDLIVARLEHARNPGTGPEATDKQHDQLAKQLRNVAAA